MADIEINELPLGWEWTTLSEIAELAGGGTPSRKVPEYFEGNIVWFTPTEVPKDKITTVYDSKERITEEAVSNSSAKVLPPGTVLLTSRASIGYVAIAGTELTTNQGFASFVCENGIHNLYLAYWLWANAEHFNHIATGTTFKEISKRKLRDVVIALAPTDEQIRIAQEIEAQLSGLDTWLEVMEKLRVELPRLRASILKAAVEGRLVAQNLDDEPAEVLLQRILDEHRRKWEEDYLANLEAKDKPAPKNDKWKEKYKEPLPPDYSDVVDIPQLPDGWIWASLDEVSANEDNSITDGPFGSKLKTSHYTDEGARVIRLQNIGDGDFLDDDKVFVSLDHYRTLLKHEVFPNDIIIAALGETLPRACMIPGAVGPAIVKADCVKFKPHPHMVVSTYMNLVLNSETVKAIASNKIHGVGRPRLNQTEIKSLPVPIAPYSLQLLIVEVVEEKLSVIDRLLAIIEVNVRRAERMRQSILKKAFEGRLVEQYPDDEPASKLLERTKEERKRRAEEEKQKPKQKRERKVSTKIERKSLYDTLKEAGKPLSVRGLFQQAGFTHDTVDDFYEELREAVYESGTIQHKRSKSNEVFLEVAG